MSPEQSEDPMADSQEMADTDIDIQSGNKIYCANCINCKLVRVPTGEGNQYQLRVRCDAGKWRKKLGEEKIYKYFTVARRSPDNCEDYEPMGDTKEFIRELKKTLPIRDEVYTNTL
jgi:hypothetical protein